MHEADLPREVKRCIRIQSELLADGFYCLLNIFIQPSGGKPHGYHHRGIVLADEGRAQGFAIEYRGNTIDRLGTIIGNQPVAQFQGIVHVLLVEALLVINNDYAAGFFNAGAEFFIYEVAGIDGLGLFREKLTLVGNTDLR